MSLPGGSGASANGRGGGNKVPRLRLSMMAVVAIALFASLFARLYDLQVVRLVRLSAAGRGQPGADRAGRRRPGAGSSTATARCWSTTGWRWWWRSTATRSAICSGPAQDGAAPTAHVRADHRGPPHHPRGDHPAARRQALQPLRPGARGHRRPRGAQDLLSTSTPTSSRRWWSQRTAVRALPYGTLAAQTLGYVGKINDDELTVRPSGRGHSQAVHAQRPDREGRRRAAPTRPYLRGTPGLRRIEVDAEGDPVRVISDRQPQAGRRPGAVHRHRLQALAEQALQQGLADARARPPRNGNPPNNATTGAAVVEDPNNGQLLALASYPDLRPHGVRRRHRRQRVGLPQRPGQRPARSTTGRSRASGRAGSTYKLFMGYAALHSGLMAPDTVFHDWRRLPDPRLHGAKCYRSNAGGAAYGSVTISRTRSPCRPTPSSTTWAPSSGCSASASAATRACRACWRRGGSARRPAWR